MSTTSYYNKSAETIVKTYASATKSLVSALVSLDPMLSIYSVVTDTTDVYSAIIRISGSVLAVKVYNSSSVLYMYTGRIKPNGEFSESTAINSFPMVSDPYVITPSAKNCAISWGLGNCLRYVGVSGSLVSGSCSGFLYGTFTANNSDTAIMVITTFLTSGIGFPSASIIRDLPKYVYMEDTDTAEQIIYAQPSLGSDSLLSGFKYTLQPIGYSARTNTKGFLNIRWGGAHKLYRLYELDKPITTSPGQTVNINGNNFLSVGYVTYAV